ncbi:MAG: DUF1385 domain-containing protein [Chloroflexota bacterium]
MAKRFFYGGQAVIEGVMIRGQKAMVTAVRRPDGNLAIDTQPLTTLPTSWMRQTPLIRGIIALIESMVLGIRSLLYSANVSLEEEGEKASGGLAWIIVAVGFVLAFVLFFLIPLYLTKLFNFSSSFLFNLTDGIIRVVIFIAYLKVMTLLPDIKRVFAYHGAEHKAVNAFEAGVPMEVTAVREYSKAHTRCGTSFLFAVFIIAIIVFALIGLHSAWLMVLSRIILIPVIAALSYELIYFGARHTNNGLVRTVLAPGLWLQSLTTREPDDSQLEVALSALKGAVEADQAEQTAPPSPSIACQ